MIVHCLCSMCPIIKVESNVKFLNQSVSPESAGLNQSVSQSVSPESAGLNQSVSPESAGLNQSVQSSPVQSRWCDRAEVGF